MRRATFILLLAVSMFAAGAVGSVLQADSEPADDTPSQVDPYAVGGLGSADLDQTVTTLQEHLRQQPADARSWATLGLAYVEQARVTGDPAYYAKADEVLARSQAEQSDDNDLALAGLAALQAARHDFGAALRLAERALAINRYQSGALAVRVDALTELGRYRDALAAAWKADAKRPGLPSSARLSYAYELRGDYGRATSLLRRAASQTMTPADAAFTRVLLADLARRRGDLDSAGRHLKLARRADPTYLPALVSRARLQLANGDTPAAIRLMRTVVARLPLPEHLVELGELYEFTGRPKQAQAQYDVVRAAQQLLSTNGVVTDLEAALFEADHGDPEVALAAARAEWRRRHSIHVADALAWALHRNDRNKQALHYARIATRLGTRDPHLHYHRGAIESALGRKFAAARSLRSALAADPGFAPLQRAEAARLLERLAERR